MTEVVFHDGLDCLDYYRHSVFLSLFIEILDKALKELYSIQDVELQVVPECSPNVAPA